MTTEPTISDAQLDEIERLAAKATPGPWEWSTSCSFRRLSARADGDVLCAVRQRSDGHPDIEGKQANMKFIAACDPTTILSLARELRQLRAEKERGK